MYDFILFPGLLLLRFVYVGSEEDTSILLSGLFPTRTELKYMFTVFIFN